MQSRMVSDTQSPSCFSLVCPASATILAVFLSVIIFFQVPFLYQDSHHHYFLVLLFILYLCYSSDRVLLFNLGWPGTYYVDQPGFELMEIHLLLPPESKVKGLLPYACLVCHFPFFCFTSLVSLKCISHGH